MISLPVASSAWHVRAYPNDRFSAIKNEVSRGWAKYRHRWSSQQSSNVNHATVIPKQDCRTANQFKDFGHWPVPINLAGWDSVEQILVLSRAYDHHKIAMICQQIRHICPSVLAPRANRPDTAWCKHCNLL
jgi:hypothetical protein